jgi:hypothetical protein
VSGTCRNQSDGVPRLMSSLPTSRTWILSEDRRRWLDRREIMVLAALAAALFVCSFAIGRAARPSAAPAEAARSAIGAAARGATIPALLSGVPSIKVIVPVIRRPAPAPRARTPVAPAAVTPAPQSAPPASAPAEAAPPEATPAPAPSPPVVKAPAPTPAPAPSTGKTFESSA